MRYVSCNLTGSLGGPDLRQTRRRETPVVALARQCYPAYLSSPWSSVRDSAGHRPLNCEQHSLTHRIAVSEELSWGSQPGEARSLRLSPSSAPRLLRHQRGEVVTSTLFETHRLSLPDSLHILIRFILTCSYIVDRIASSTFVAHRMHR